MNDLHVSIPTSSPPPAPATCTSKPNHMPASLSTMMKKNTQPRPNPHDLILALPSEPERIPSHPVPPHLTSPHPTSTPSCSHSYSNLSPSPHPPTREQLQTNQYSRQPPT